MKKLLKGFTLVEILIVIVIIGILIGALVPRMQSAQGRARDVARKNDLSQLQAAILVSYQDKGKWPKVNDCASTTGCDIKDIESEILAAGMNGTPKDPLTSNEVTGLGDKGTAGQYRYINVKSYGTEKGGFALMAKTEVEGGSNWVVCTTGAQQPVACSKHDNDQDACEAAGSPCTWNASDGTCGGGTYNVGSQTQQGFITTGDDIKDLKPCASLDKTAPEGTCTNDKKGKACTYSNESQLRYVLFN